MQSEQWLVTNQLDSMVDVHCFSSDFIVVQKWDFSDSRVVEIICQG